MSAMKSGEGFQEVRRGLWTRTTRDADGIVEVDLVTGPEGGDVGVVLRAGDVITPDVLHVLDEILGATVDTIPIPTAEDLLAEGWRELPAFRDDRRRFECPRGVFVVRLPPRTAQEARDVRGIVASARNVRTDE